jgi:hypothetical protein
LAARRDPALDAVADPTDTVLNVINPIASGVGTFGDRRLDAHPVLRMYAGDEYFVIDIRVGWQTPHSVHAGIPVESVGLRVP